MQRVEFAVQLLKHCLLSNVQGVEELELVVLVPADEAVEHVTRGNHLSVEEQVRRISLHHVLKLVI